MLEGGKDKKMDINIYNDTTIKWKDEKGVDYCLHIQADKDSETPRTFFDSFTTMACFHPRYNLGDDIGRGITPHEFIREFVRKNVEERDIIKFALDGKLKSVKLKKSSSKGLYDIFEITQIRTIFGRSDPEETLEYEGVNLGNAVYFIIDDISINDCLFLAKQVAEVLPLWLYDHSGITMSCGERNYPYNDQWDSSQVGWIIALKEETIKWTGANEDNWREKARDNMKSDVEIYDRWLCGDVYGYTLYTRDTPDEEWTETDDSCWGFYGSDLVGCGIADEVGHDLLKAIENDAVVVGEAKHVIVNKIVL